MRACQLCGRTASCGCAFNSQGLCKICVARAQGAQEEIVPLDIRMELSSPGVKPEKTLLSQPAPDFSATPTRDGAHHRESPMAGTGGEC